MADENGDSMAPAPRRRFYHRDDGKMKASAKIVMTATPMLLVAGIIWGLGKAAWVNETCKQAQRDHPKVEECVGHQGEQAQLNAQILAEQRATNAKLDRLIRLIDDRFYTGG